MGGKWVVITIWMYWCMYYGVYCIVFVYELVYIAQYLYDFFSQITGNTLPYDELHHIQARLEEVAPHLVRYGDMEPANFFGLAHKLIKVTLVITHRQMLHRQWLKQKWVKTVSQALREKGGSPMKEASWLNLNGVKWDGQLIDISKEIN